MKLTTDYRLSLRQIWTFTLSLTVIYYPILLYVYLPELSWALLRKASPFILGQGILTTLSYFCWIYFTEWILQRLSERYGEEVLVEFKFSSQLLILAGAVGAAILISLFYQGLFSLAMLYITPPSGAERWRPDPVFGEYLARSQNGFTVIIMLSIFYVAANRRANRRLKDIQVQTERYQKEAALAQFAALKDQVSPHFLFNSLSILSSLVHVDADLSEQFIDKLSKAYRYILEQKDNDRVSLRTELDFIRSYTFLLKIRFEESFEVYMEVPDAVAQQYYIPPMTLQLLVENAVKHNRMTPEQPLFVQIQVEDDYLVVKNPLQPREQMSHSTGIGLKNIINRYQQFTTRPVRIEEEESTFIVKIPLLS
ncbi:sensor histidine kinase [Telluribacter sp.]|uniref:sensor histidine kinase n=1 Tax=Telluribacter sp. TaxID=1978767 RepID=UPI002E103897|nr:histidine kinase [Telluribacter sp.]